MNNSGIPAEPRDGLRVLVGGHLPFQRDKGSKRRPDAGRHQRDWIYELLDQLVTPTSSTIVINGGRKGKIDEVVIEWFRDRSTGDPDMAERLWTFVATGESQMVADPPGLVEGHLPSRFVRRVQMVELADVVVVIGGKTGTSEIVGVARALRKPIVPLPFGGELAGELFEQGWTTDVLPTIPGHDVDKPTWRAPSGDETWTAGPGSVDEAVQLIHLAASIPVFVSQSHHDETARAAADEVVAIAEQAGYTILRQYGSGTIDWITTDLGRRLHRAVLTIAVEWDSRYRFVEASAGSPPRDVVGVNANVAYEVGYSIGRGMPTLIITNDGVARPFDIEGLRAIDVSTATWRDDLADTLREFRRSRTFRR